MTSYQIEVGPKSNDWRPFEQDCQLGESPGAVPLLGAPEGPDPANALSSASCSAQHLKSSQIWYFELPCDSSYWKLTRPWRTQLSLCPLCAAATPGQRHPVSLSDLPAC